MHISTFSGHIPGNGVTYVNPTTGAYGIYDDRRTLVPYRYVFNIPEITLSVSQDGLLVYDYKALWRHDVDYTFLTEEFSWSELTRFKYNNRVNLNTEVEHTFQGNIEFCLTTFDEDSGTLNYLSTLDTNKIHIEDFNSDNKIAVRIKEIELPSTENDLFIALRIIKPDNYVSAILTKSYELYDPNRNRWVFRPEERLNVVPENWNPLEEDSRFTLTKTRRSVWNPRSEITHQAFTNNYDVPKYYHDTKGLTPEGHVGWLYYFKVHDYQPKDTETSIAQKEADNQSSSINPFPAIHAARSTYENQVIADPDLGKSHLQIDIPYGENWKKIDYIELEVLNHGHTIIVNLEDHETNGNELTYTANAYYNDRDSTGIDLEIKGLSSMSSWDYRNWNIHEDLQFGEGDDSMLLLNVPATVGDVINVSTFYTDGSLSRDMLSVPAVDNNSLSRAYYSIALNSQYLDYNSENGDLTLSDTPASWLIERLTSNLYLWRDSDGSQGTGGVIYDRDTQEYVYGPDIADGQWHQVTFVIESNGESEIFSKLYIDGSYVGETEVTSSLLQGNFNTLIGSTHTSLNRYYFSGKLDDVKIWRIALSPEQIAAEYTNNLKGVILSPSPSEMTKRRSADLLTLDAQELSIGNSSTANELSVLSSQSEDNHIDIKLVLNENTKVSYRIADMKGSLRELNSRTFNPGNHTWTINVGHLFGGETHSIKVVAGDMYKSLSFIINK